MINVDCYNTCTAAAASDAQESQQFSHIGSEEKNKNNNNKVVLIKIITFDVDQFCRVRIYIYVVYVCVCVCVCRKQITRATGPAHVSTVLQYTRTGFLRLIS